ncbi:MAG TPA: PilC/PilY family type IV pilus protein, partial [Cellvibrionaceae bacterium]|nr:PilC/PilY family type IV pilus protein [Cellvibrionaceae bacterium]
MTSQDWSANPLAIAPTSSSTIKACSKLQVVAINASSVSFDGNNIGTDLFSSIAQDTNTIGAAELSKNGSNAKYFVGDVTGNDNDNWGIAATPVCSAKTIAEFSKVRGTCPDAPALAGSYLMAGMAWKAYTTPNINPFYGKGIRTSGVSLELGRPIIQLPSAKTPKVTLLPACRNLSKVSNLYLGSCALVDFKILKYNLNTTNNSISGSALVIWEDSQQGSDFDQDVTQLIEYSYSGSQVSVTTKVLSKSTNDTLELGYIITGVDGNQEGHKNPLLINASIAANNRTDHSETYNVNQSANFMLEPPLYYAAKWGGFNLAAGKMIISDDQWDSKVNSTGAAGRDSLPDNYFVVRNPSTLSDDIKRTMDTAQPAVFAYGSVGSASTLDDGSGFSVVTQFRPTAESNNNHTVSWAGSLKGYFRGPRGYLIEDSNKSGNYEKSDLSVALKTQIQDDVPTTFAYRFKGEAPDFEKGTNLIGDPVSINKFDFAEPFFNTEAQLAMVKNYSIQGKYPIKTTGDEENDRTKHRYIFTSIDSDNDQLITGAEAQSIPFDTATGFSVTSKNTTWLDFTKGSNTDLVNFIRGKSIANFRDRRIDFVPGKSNDTDENNAADGVEPWLLGDIVNSSPLVVSSATAGYDTDYGDETYTKLRDKYKNRRNVLYVGANDGMLHAFNLGFFNADTKKYDAGGAPIGAELWAYIPFNLLPHLKWLTETDYHHNFYMDGRVKLYDVNIFTPDDDHPDGWGSILVATMRTGGTPYELTQTQANGDTVKSTLRSAVVVMDITNPEVAPKLIAEIPMPDNTYTTVNPDIFKFREFNTDGTIALNKWYLALGSGVTDRSLFTSDKTPKIFVFDLVNKKWVNNGTGVTVGTNKGWIGGINARDWDHDYYDDYMY